MYRRSCGQGDRSQGGPPVPTPKARGAATAFTEAAAAVCACRHLAILAGVSFSGAPDPITRGKPSSLGLLPTQSHPLVPLCSFRRLLCHRRRGAFFTSERSWSRLSASKAVRQSKRASVTTPSYCESYFLLETYLPFHLFSGSPLFLKSIKHPYFVKKSLDLIFQRD